MKRLVCRRRWWRPPPSRSRQPRWLTGRRHMRAFRWSRGSCSRQCFRKRFGGATLDWGAPLTAAGRDVPFPETPDGRYFVVRGRLWRRANPALGEVRVRFSSRSWCLHRWGGEPRSGLALKPGTGPCRTGRSRRSSSQVAYRIADDDQREEELAPFVAGQIARLEALCECRVVDLGGCGRRRWTGRCGILASWSVGRRATGW